MGTSFSQAVAVLLFFAAAAQAQNASPDFAKRLQEGDRLAWMTNWY